MIKEIKYNVTDWESMIKKVDLILWKSYIKIEILSYYLILK